MSKTTMWRRLSKLDEVGRICSVSDMKHCKMPTNNGGYQDVQLYNLNVLNQLAMVELDCPVLNETAKKFSDILSEVETTGSSPWRNFALLDDSQIAPRLSSDFSDSDSCS